MRIKISELFVYCRLLLQPSLVTDVFWVHASVLIHAVHTDQPGFQLAVEATKPSLGPPRDWSTLTLASTRGLPPEPFPLPAPLAFLSIAWIWREGSCVVVKQLGTKCEREREKGIRYL